EGMEDTITRIIYEHHIKYDHSGYPSTESTLHPLSQIVTICDAYDALTTLRVYQRPYQPLEAIDILKGFSGKHFDPNLLNAFVKMIGFYPVGTMVKLSSDELGVITKVDTEDKNKPTIKIIYDKTGTALEPPSEIELTISSDSELEIIMPEDPLYSKINIGEFFENEAKNATEGDE
ncbi:MAG: HD domain-containing phosphohydrolase, partial [Thermodesulfobacteriota bacterium]